MANKLVMLVMTPAPERAELCGAPFFHAAAAAAMDIEVEVYFAGPSVKLLARGVAERVFPGAAEQRSAYAFMRAAIDHGVKFYACPGALAAHGIASDQLIPEVTGIAGAAAYVARVMDVDWRALSY